MIGIFLFALGAILIWAVDAHVQYINLIAVGVILLIAGVFASILEWSLFWYPRYRRRRTYVDDEL